MESGSEISRLIELMPASGRMYCKIISNSQQSQPIAAKLPGLGQETRPISINFDQWQKIPQSQRDLLLLQSVSWLTSIRWFQPSLYEGLTLAGVALTSIELLQANATGIVTFGGLTALAAAQVWRKNRSQDVVFAADEQAVAIAQRRGYGREEAVAALVDAIKALADLEGRDLTFTETLRCQNLQQLLGSISV
jgi:Protein of unknown function (DUF3318)